MPEFKLWKSADFSLFQNQTHITFFRVVHLLLGLVLLIPATYNVIEVIRINRQAHAGKNNPIFLITNGFYSNVRHPMIGMFMSIILGLFFSFCSILALFIAFLLIAFLHLTIIYEEKTMLIPRFGSEYLEYINRVPSRYFTQRQIVIIVVVLILGTLGALV
jgi:protein-S-isoprenylcysteine O-methyltransferase Ste14